ncbi:MAG: transcriptional regulator [Treponema sp.]|uniref:P-II family nitrogen regulator n=1 Tax=Treponema sp. TaxID=166 RepID=UPI001B6D670C|nr:P-II family nitrogen regulator [Treponema sp.]MBP5402124.1 transcriptional regulator [Treponema sp.]MBR5933459.1 transcriptional regulator [Treponema sp.]
MNYKLIVTVVPQYSGELITNAARDSGCPGGTVLMGTETSANGFVQLLGFGDAPKDITYNLVESDKAPAIISAIKKVTSEKKRNLGILFSICVDQFIKAGDSKVTSSDKGEEKMAENDYEMINVIVNSGYAEDAMVAARKAGAGGGTIIKAHGTAREGDAKFFGTEIVPEKDMLMILVPGSKKDAIVNAIQELNCFKKAGSGIIFCNVVKDFTVLGKN